MNAKLPVFKFTPYYKEVIWGGNRIAMFKGLEAPGGHIGESWEVSDLPGKESHVDGGFCHGMSLSALLEAHGHEIMGGRLYSRYGRTFPLLVKFLDAETDLSIQVHPDDIIAARKGKTSGKTELWYSIGADSGAYIYTGMQSGVTGEAVRRHVMGGTITDVLNRVSPRPGDVFYLPAGRVHSMGGGNFMLEIQQPSDVTYRLYDYNRTDADGRPRELHVDEAIEAMDFREYDDYMLHTVPVADHEVVMKECPFFTVTIVKVKRECRLNVSRYGSFRILVAVDGHGTVTDDSGRTTEVKRGETLLVPASADYVTVKSNNGDLDLITVYIR